MPCPSGLPARVRGHPPGDTRTRTDDHDLTRSRPLRVAPTLGSPVSRPARLQSLDVLRGVTIAAMMLVNKQGNDAGYAALQHVPWHGATPTDWIFPFFLFMVGVALPFSIASRRRQGASNAEILRHAFWRALILFALGMFEKNFPFLSTTLDTVRIPGVLQRIGFCYFAGTALLLYTTRKQQGVIAALLLVGYWVLLAFVPVPGLGVVPMTREFASQNWAAWVDQLTMGRHLGYGNHTWDANGLLSSLPSIVTLAGRRTGRVDPRGGPHRRGDLAPRAGRRGRRDPRVGLGWVPAADRARHHRRAERDECARLPDQQDAVDEQLRALHRRPRVPVAGRVPLARGPGTACRRRPTLDDAVRGPGDQRHLRVPGVRAWRPSCSTCGRWPRATARARPRGAGHRCTCSRHSSRRRRWPHSCTRVSTRCCGS